jgi:hypothetical protein
VFVYAPFSLDIVFPTRHQSMSAHTLHFGSSGKKGGNQLRLVYGFRVIFSVFMFDAVNNSLWTHVEDMELSPAPAPPMVASCASRA